MNFKEKYAYKKLRKLTSNVKRVAEIPDLNNIKRVGVIYLADQTEAFEHLRNYFSKKSIIFRSLCINKIKKPVDVSANELTLDDLNWWGLPKPEKFEDFMNLDFDVLLDISMERSLIFDYLNALTRARFKIGYSESEDNYFDLNINIGKKKEGLFLAQQQIFYLSQLNQKENK